VQAVDTLRSQPERDAGSGLTKSDEAN